MEQPYSRTLSFSADVHPVLVRHCIKCHDSAFRGDFRTPVSALQRCLTRRELRAGSATPMRRRSCTSSNPETRIGAACGALVAVGYHGCSSLYGMPKGDERGLLIDFDPAGAEAIRAWIVEGAPQS